jgi:hypothetical protein
VCFDEKRPPFDENTRSTCKHAKYNLCPCSYRYVALDSYLRGFSSDPTSAGNIGTRLQHPYHYAARQTGSNSILPRISNCTCVPFLSFCEKTKLYCLCAFLELIVPRRMIRGTRVRRTKRGKDMRARGSACDEVEHVVLLPQAECQSPPSSPTFRPARVALCAAGISFSALPHVITLVAHRGMSLPYICSALECALDPRVTQSLMSA